MRPPESAFPAEIEKTVLMTRKSRVGCSYPPDSVLLTQPGLHDSRRSGILNNKMTIIQFLKVRVGIFINQ